MKMKETKPMGHFVCEDNPQDWVRYFMNDPRLGTPTRFMISVDGRIIGLETGSRTKGPARHVKQEVRFFPESDDERFFPIRHFGVIFGKGTFDENYKKLFLKTTHTKFASREQQDRAIGMLIGAVQVLGKNHPSFGGVIKFSEDIWAKLERGSYIFEETEQPRTSGLFGRWLKSLAPNATK